MDDFLSTSDNQFGFKKKHGTDMCIYVLKEVIAKYQALNSCLFMCFLDASEVFDRVSHTVLFKKLINRGIPGYIVRILVFWFANQQMCVKWGRQGGILSPYLFSVYMDGLSTVLNGCNVVCYVGYNCVNNIMYADDLIVFCLSSRGYTPISLSVINMAYHMT